MDKVRVLCTGSEGYLGTVLVDKLLANDLVDIIVGVDACFFGENNVDDSGKYMLVKERVENMPRGWGYWLDEIKPNIVIALAAISNDPACELNPVLTKIVNHYSVVHLALECKLRRIPLVFASSAAVYGSVNYVAGEWSPTYPISLYAEEKLATERDLFAMADNCWQPQVFRMGTLFGISKRPRFDLAIPGMLKDALLSRCITVFGGEQWRPFLSLDDATNFYSDMVNGYVYQRKIMNLVSFNITINNLAKCIAEFVKERYNYDVDIVNNTQTLDSRNYQLFGPIFDKVTTMSLFNMLDEMSKQILELGPDDIGDDKYYTVRALRRMLK